MAFLKRLIWVYLLLWIFEGVFRKWILPEYSAQLLLVRDPVAVWIVVYALWQRLWRVNVWILVLIAIGSGAFLMAFLLEVNFPVVLIGLRTLCLHFPLVFILGEVLTREDIERAGNIFLDLSLPMGLLMALQFASPSNALINAGAGIDAMQIDAVDGRIRAPGVFSFITGAAQYYSLVAAFLLSRLVSREGRSFWLLTFAAIGLVLAMATAISRTLTIGIVIVLMAFLVGCMRTGVPLRKLLPAMGIVIVIGLAFSVSDTVREGLEAFMQRWTLADEGEGSVFVRAFNAFTVDRETLATAGLTGHGLGVGTNMGAKLMTGDVGFLLAEEEWPRVVLEMGVPLGFAFILWRVSLALSLASKCLASLIRADILPIVLFAAAGPVMLNGQTGVPATLGFFAISAGLALAAAGSRRVFVIKHGLLVHRAQQRPLKKPQPTTAEG